MVADREARRLDPVLTFAEANPEALVVFVGPTASGKTERAVALAERVGGEIVSADSVQVYRGFDVGSGKPTPDELARAAHHLVDVLDPLDPFDAAAFVTLADARIADVRARGKRPIVCGGTFLWIRALLHGLAESPAADPALRARHRDLVERLGAAALHERLQAVDPAAAARLHPNDVLRVSRALEVFETSGQRLSDRHATHAFAEQRYPAGLFAVARTPEASTERITTRVEHWLARGWIEETERLLAAGFAGARAMGSVGYRQIAEHLAGTIARDELAIAIVRATRVFARRQRTWLNHAPVTYLPGD